MSSIKLEKRYGWFENVDFYDDILLTSWKRFAGHSKYDRVGTFEGAMYGKGIWIPEFNSCMNNNILYFNAPTRWAQVRRIHKLAGIDCTFSQFLQDDQIPVYPTSARSKDKDFVPLAPRLFLCQTRRGEPMCSPKIITTKPIDYEYIIKRIKL